MGKFLSAFSAFLTAPVLFGVPDATLFAQVPSTRPAAPAAGAQRPPQAGQRADDRQWQSLADQSEELLGKGDFSGAERVGRALVEEGRRVFGDGHPNLASSYS